MMKIYLLKAPCARGIWSGTYVVSAFVAGDNVKPDPLTLVKLSTRGYSLEEVAFNTPLDAEEFAAMVKEEVCLDSETDDWPEVG